MEKGVFKGKDFYILLICFSLLFAYGVIQPDVYITLDFIFFALVFAILIPIGYLYLAIKLPAARKNITLIFVGFFIFGMAVMMVNPDFIVSFPTLIHELYFLSSVIQIPGYIIFAIGVKRMYFA